MAKKSGKIGFPMPTAKTRFHILDLHLKKHIIIEKNTFFGCTFSGPLQHNVTLFILNYFFRRILGLSLR